MAKKPEPEVVQRMFVEPVQTLSARQLAAMPLSKMQQQLDAPEKHATKEKSVGHSAGRILARLREGWKLLHTVNRERARFQLMPPDASKPAVSVAAKAVRQLEARGYLL